jgi:hypothetical protein
MTRCSFLGLIHVSLGLFSLPIPFLASQEDHCLARRAVLAGTQPIGFEKGEGMIGKQHMDQAQSGSHAGNSPPVLATWEIRSKNEDFYQKEWESKSSGMPFSRTDLQVASTGLVLSFLPLAGHGFFLPRKHCAIKPLRFP